MECKHPVVNELSFEAIKIVSGSWRSKGYVVMKKNTGKLYFMRVFKNCSYSDLETQYNIELFLREYFDRIELFHLLREERRLSENVTRIYAAELFLALDILHKNNISISLRPEHIFLDSNGHVILCELDESKEITEGMYDRYRTFDGTPEYFAPETLIGNERDKIACDWWTYGVIVYEMLTGLPPFYSENISEMYELILEKEVTFPENQDLEISTECKDFLQKLLIKDPKKRLGCRRTNKKVSEGEKYVSSSSSYVDEIKNHPFFETIDWKLLEKKMVIIDDGFLSQLTRTKDKYKYHDDEFFSEPAFGIDNNIDSTTKKTSDMFKNFTFERSQNMSEMETPEIISNKKEEMEENKNNSCTEPQKERKENYESKKKVSKPNPKERKDERRQEGGNNNTVEKKKEIDLIYEIEKYFVEEDEMLYYYSWYEEEEKRRKKEQSYLDEMERIEFLIKYSSDQEQVRGKEEIGKSVFPIYLFQRIKFLFIGVEMNVYKSIISGLKQ